MSSSRHNARKAIVQALYQWDLTQQDAKEIEHQFVKIHDMKNMDTRYFQQIVSTLPNVVDELELIIKQFIGRELSALDPIEKAVLRLGAFELQYRDDVPTKVIMNEMIEVAKVFGSQYSYKFINGVMDKIAKHIRS